MTAHKALTSTLGYIPDDDAIEKALADQGLTPQTIYVSATHKKLIDYAAMAMMLILLTTPDTGNEQGHWAKYDRKAMIQRYNMLRDEYGLSLYGVSSVRNISHLW